MYFYKHNYYIAQMYFCTMIYRLIQVYFGLIGKIYIITVDMQMNVLEII